MKIISFILFCLVFLILEKSFGTGIGLDPETALEDASVIAYISILSDAEVKPLPEKNPDNLKGFNRLATAKVITPIKACKENDILQLNHDNGYDCPNIKYFVNEDCLVLLKKSERNTYDTMSLYCGKFEVKDRRVINFYLHITPEHTESLDDVVKWIKQK